MKRRLLSLILALFAALSSTVLLVWALGAAQAETARARLVHAVPGPLIVDVLLDGVLVYDDVAYKDVTPYTEAAAGWHTVTARTVFGDLTQTVYLTGGLDATVIGVGGGQDITVTALLDDNRVENANKLRLVHLSADTPAMDVTLTGTLGVVGVEALPYKEASAYLGGLGPGVVTLSVRAGEVDVPLHPPTMTLEEHAVHTLFLMGQQAYLEGVPSVDALFSEFKLYLPIVLSDAR
jgi:hypothetical protein